MTLEHLTILVSAIGMTTAATRRSSQFVSAPQMAGRKAEQAKSEQAFQVEVAAKFECSKGRRCGENTLGEQGKGTEEW